MRTREKNLWKWLSAGRLEISDPLFFERIENSLSSGFPDVVGTFQKRSTFIELKVIEDFNARPLVRITHLTMLQVEYLRIIARTGTRTWLLVQTGADERCLIPGRAVDPAWARGRVARSTLTGLSETRTAARARAIILRSFGFMPAVSGGAKPLLV